MKLRKFSQSAKSEIKVVEDDPLQECCRTMLDSIGEDAAREGLAKTPERFSRAFRELTAGYSQNLNSLLRGAIFSEPGRQMVVVKNMEFYSMCEHHLLPFFGMAHIGYIPDGKIIGLSKIPRIVNMFARRLQIQERLGMEIVQAIDELVKPLGVGCMIESYHMCMMMRGVQSQNGTMVTNYMSGTLLTNPASREEFLSIIKSGELGRSVHLSQMSR